MTKERIKKVRFGQIGCGDIAQIRYLPSYQVAENTELAAICDSSAETLTRVASLFPGVACYGDYAELLKDESVDAVVITTPPDTHNVVAIAAAQAGKHILLEKPMALNLKDADAIAKAAEDERVTLLPMPFDEFRTLTEVRRIVDQGRIGRLVTFEATAAHNGTNHSQWFYKRGGGVLSDLGIYPLTWITGLVGPAARVSANASIVVPERRMLDGDVVRCEVEDNIVLTLQWSDGTLAAISSNCATGGLGEIYQVESWRGKRIFSMNIYGREGFIHVDYDDSVIVVSAGRANPHDQVAFFAGLEGYAPKLEEYSELSERTGNGPKILDHFSNAVREKKSPMRSVHQQLHVVEIIERAYASVESGTVQALTTSF
jgi:predicted dehydrogenase